MEWNSVKVFSATKAKEREQLGERVTEWIKRQRGVHITNTEVLQSSDHEFHCLSIIVFYRGDES